MVEPGLGPLGVPLHLRRVSDPELLSDEVQNHHRNIQRILQERPHRADRHELKAEPELHVLAAMPLHQRPVLVVEEEHPFLGGFLAGTGLDLTPFL